jgi:GNAT superfamily N-acetyltransferase
MAEYELVSPSDAGTWQVYHAIRREVLFEARGLFGVYDENRPDERAPGNHSKLLLVRGAPVGVIRIDIAGNDAIFRRVAIRRDVQRRGHGHAMLSLAESFAMRHGCKRILSHVAPDAVAFYEKCGFARARDAAAGDDEAVFMSKRLV